MKVRPRKQFEVEGLTLTTSSYTENTQTDWCVGVGEDCDHHRVIGDSKTRTFGLRVSNGEFLAALASAKV